MLSLYQLNIFPFTVTGHLTLEVDGYAHFAFGENHVTGPLSKGESCRLIITIFGSNGNVSVLGLLAPYFPVPT